MSNIDGMKGSYMAAEKKTYVRGSVRNILDYIIDPSRGGLKVKKLKTGEIFDLSTNSQGELVYIVPPNNKKLIDPQDSGFVLEEESAKKLDEHLAQIDMDKASPKIDDKGTRGITLTIPLLVNAVLYKGSGNPENARAQAARQLQSTEDDQDLEMIDKAEAIFRVDIEDDGYATFDDIIAEYMAAIYDSINDKITDLKLEGKKAKKVIVEGNILNIPEIQRPLNRELQRHLPSFRYRGKLKDGRAFRKLIIVFKDEDL